MELLSQRLLHGKVDGNKLKEICRVNDVPIKIIKGFSFKAFSELSCRVLRGGKQKNNEPTEQSWQENERKLFYWIVLIKSFESNTLIKQFNESIWSEIKSIFPTKTQSMFEYEASQILNENSLYKRWENEENELFLSIMRRSKKIKWSEISKALYQESGKNYIRNGKQCREHWLNHVNPNVSKAPWNKAQYIQLLENLLKFGRKWARISKEFGGFRSEHMLKNKMRSLQTKYGWSQFSETSYNAKVEKMLSLIRESKSIDANGLRMKRKMSMKEYLCTFSKLKIEGQKEGERSLNNQFMLKNEEEESQSIGEIEDDEYIKQQEQSENLLSHHQSEHKSEGKIKPLEKSSGVKNQIKEEYQAYEFIPQLETENKPANDQHAPMTHYGAPYYGNPWEMGIPPEEYHHYYPYHCYPPPYYMYEKNQM